MMDSCHQAAAPVVYLCACPACLPNDSALKDLGTCSASSTSDVDADVDADVCQRKTSRVLRRAKRTEGALNSEGHEVTGNIFLSAK